MGKAVKRRERAARKLDHSNVDAFLEQRTREERQTGGAVDALPDEQLFFVDREPEAAAPPSPAAPRLSRKAAARAKLTRAEAILAGAHAAQSVATAPKQRPKGRLPDPRKRKADAAAAKAEPVAGAAAAAAAAADVWASAGRAGKRARAAARARRGPIPALEVDAPGCSYNPDREAHQDAVAEAVAAEMRKAYARALAPTAPARFADAPPEDDELMRLLGMGDGETGGEEGAAAAASDGDDEGAGARPAPRPKTQRDRNREARRRAAEAGAAAAAAAKAQRRALAALPALAARVEAEAAARAARLARRAAGRAERARAEPPRLGRQRFEPMPLQVLASDEITGSLRQLKPTPTLALDRFRALQKRGAIEPRRRVVWGQRSKRVEFIRGRRGDDARERQAELDELRKAAKDARKAAAQQQREAVY